MANPKIFTFREVTTHTDMNELVDDVRKDFIMLGMAAGFTGDDNPTFHHQTAATSQGGSPDFTFPLHVPTGQFINIAYRVDGDGVVSTAFLVDGPGGIDTIDLGSEGFDSDVMVSKDITALPNNGDIRAVPVTLQLFLWGSTGNSDIWIHWVRSSNYSAEADNWFL
jgi:hypothetical protein